MIPNSTDALLELIKPPADRLEQCEGAVSRAIDGLRSAVHLREAPTPKEERERFGKIRDLAKRMEDVLGGVHQLVADELLRHVGEIRAAADLFDPPSGPRTGIQIPPGSPRLDPVHLRAAYLSRSLLLQFSPHEALDLARRNGELEQREGEDQDSYERRMWEHSQKHKRPAPTLGPIQRLAQALLLAATGEEEDLDRASRRVVDEFRTNE